MQGGGKMKRVIILTMVMALALAGTAWADLPTQGQRITYGGYVGNMNQAGMVDADTLVCVFNPNEVIVPGVGIAIFDSSGVKLTDLPLLDPKTGQHVSSIQPKGWVYMTLGTCLPPMLRPPLKYTYVVYWIKPVTIPWRGIVIEIKEILYTQPVYPWEGCWMPSLIRAWSEAPLGAFGVKAK
jgi:hypothetical protein